MKRLLIFGTVMVLALLLAIPAAADPPAAEDKVEGVDEIGETIQCDDGVIFRDREGWVNYHRNGFNFHITITYTNSDGDTWVYQDTGRVRAWIDKSGDEYVSVSGHTTDVPPIEGADVVDGDGNYGRWVLNESYPEEFSVVGSYRGVIEDAACEALTG